MPQETCEYHALLVSDIAVIKNDIAYIKEKVCSHITEGEKQGGFRDRVFLLEKEVAELKRRFWASAFIGGIIGALIGSGSGDVIAAFMKWVMGIK